jgi:signal transduction histidine kinase
MTRERKIDLAIALGAFASATLILFLHGFEDGGEDVRDADALGVAVVAVMTLPLVARRRQPLAVFACAAAATVANHALEYPGVLGLWPALAVYSLAAYAPNPEAARFGGLVAGSAFAVLAAIALFIDPSVGIAAGAAGWAGAWVAGDLTRQRHERIAELEERARRAEREAERERALAAAEERTRIARDLHDSAGHAMNVILVQAGAARLLRERDPEQARQALETIENVARTTIGEIDRLVHALRDEAAPDDRAPLPGVAEIDDLVEDHRASGLAVTVTREGERRSCGPGVGRAAYRIVQEALTNAARHGDGAAEVALHFGPSSLDITVDNPVGGNGTPEGARGGHGLAGMRERAALLGGTLDARRDGGSFHVRAVLPYEFPER